MKGREKSMEQVLKNTQEINKAHSDEPIVRVEDLHVSFFTHAGEVKAVNGITYELRPGQVLGIVGESGSGKSVSVNALMKLLQFPGRVTDGAIYFREDDIETFSEKQMQHIRGKDIAMIFQDPMTSLDPVFTIGNQLCETIRKHLKVSSKEAEKRAIEMLSLVGINNPEGRMKQYPFEFSGGMRQRVMIAMALSCNPDVLIADEPTTALDVTIQAQILDLMKSLREKMNSSIILITHDLGIVSDICDEIMVMYAGRIVERGTTEDIFYRPAHPYTKGLLSCIPKVGDSKDKPLTAMEGTPVDLLMLPKGCPFASRCDECLEICLQEKPPIVPVSDAHTSECWQTAIKQGLVNGGQANE